MSNSILLKGAGYLTLSAGIFILSGYLTNIWLGRTLGPVDYGIYGVVISLMSFINVLQTSGLTQSASKYIAEDEKNADSVLKSAMYLQFLFTVGITIIFFLLAYPLSILLNDSSLVPYIQLISFVFPIYGFYALFIDYYNGRHQFKKQAILSIIYSLIKLVFIVIFGLIWGLVGAFIGFIIAPLVALLYGFHLPRNIRKNFPYKKLFLFSIPLVTFIFSYMLLQSIDLYFVKALLVSEADPGYYTANQNITKIPILALSALSSVLFPSISRNLAQKQIEKIRFLIHKSLRLILILLIPGTLLIAATSEQIIHLLYSTAYLPAAPSLSILIFASGFLTVFTILANILNGAGEPKKSLWISALGVSITAILCLVLVPRYGLVGAAFSTTVGSFTAMVLATYFVYKRFKALVQIRSVIKIMLASGVIYILAKLFVLPVIFLPILYIVLFGIYLGMLIVLREVTKDDWKQIRGLIPTWIPFV